MSMAASSIASSNVFGASASRILPIVSSMSLTVLSVDSVTAATAAASPEPLANRSLALETNFLLSDSSLSRHLFSRSFSCMSVVSSAFARICAVKSASFFDASVAAEATPSSSVPLAAPAVDRAAALAASAAASRSSRPVGRPRKAGSRARTALGRVSLRNESSRPSMFAAPSDTALAAVADDGSPMSLFASSTIAARALPSWSSVA
mmetsp:Transcript_3191/g.10498  ORF Transcript_3191/g.10498 Transcript_3191/m.10498 type:complete len:207 (+) Transcript_3191:503-1123(+)